MIFREIKTKNEPIRLHINKWTEEKGKAFLQKVIDQSKTFLRSKYMFLDKDLPFKSQVENYRWLLVNDLINQEEYEHLKLELKRLKGISD